MKKVIISLVAILLLGNLNCYANNTNEDIELNLSGSNIIKQTDETFTLTLQLGNFTEISDNCVLGYEAVLDYDEDIFESVTVKGGNGWNANYKDSTKILIGDTSSAKANTEITKIIFKLKKGIKPTTTDITLNNILVTNAQNDFEYNKKVTVTIQENEPINTNNSTNIITPSLKNNSISSKNSDTTTTAKELPKAGNEIIIVVGIIILIVSAIIFGRSYIYYLKDTHKQIRKEQKSIAKKKKK